MGGKGMLQVRGGRVMLEEHVFSKVGGRSRALMTRAVGSCRKCTRRIGQGLMA